jgi:hypothetical protein
MKPVLPLLVLLAACSPSGQQAQESNEQAPVPSKAGQAGPAGSLTGLYESGPANQPNQLCMIERRVDEAEFGLVVWGANLHSCSGTGTARRSGDTLRLTMAGDSECVIEAETAGDRVTLPDSLGAGCAYYCGARAQMSGAEFARKGSTREDALKATDLVGESLCGEGN